MNLHQQISRLLKVISMLILLPNYMYVGNTLNLKSYRFITIVPKSLIPPNETEYNETTKEFYCDQWPGLKAAYIFDRKLNETVLFCSEEDYVMGGYCPEWNSGKLQPNVDASCRMYLSTPCPYKLNVWESYKYPGCFMNDTSTNQNETKEDACTCRNDTVTDRNITHKETKVDTCAVFNVPLIISLVFNFILGSCIIIFAIIFYKKGSNSQSSSSSLLESVISVKDHEKNKKSQKDEETVNNGMETEDSRKDGENEALVDCTEDEADEVERQSEPFLQHYYDETEFNDQEESFNESDERVEHLPVTPLKFGPKIGPIPNGKE